MPSSKHTDQPTYILWLDEISKDDLALVGTKNATLAQIRQHFKNKEVHVPDGFAITTRAYTQFLEATGLFKKIKRALKTLDISSTKQLRQFSKETITAIRNAPLPADIEDVIQKEYRALKKQTSQKPFRVVVRSSATLEDLPEASFAGKQETILNVQNEKDVLEAVKKCMASVFSERAMIYRAAKGFDHLAVHMSVTIQHQVAASQSASGVMFTMDTESGFEGVTLIDASYGLGEYIARGRVSPDQYFVWKEGLQKGKSAVISKFCGTKSVKLVSGKGRGTKQVKVKASDQNKFCLSEEDVITLAKIGQQIEQYFGTPQDIEWAKDSKTGTFYIVQTRRETIKSPTKHAMLERAVLKKKGKVLASGTAIGQGIATGNVRIVDTLKAAERLRAGNILVTRRTTPDWEGVLRKASAVITEQGGKTSHTAIMCRELGIPCVTGVVDARTKLSSTKQATVSCAEGEQGFVYKGTLPYEVQKLQIDRIPNTKTQIMMNIGNPHNAFTLAQIPSDGAGLVRQEMIVQNVLNIHPQALVSYSSIKNTRLKKQIAERTRGYKNKKTYFVDALAEGIGRVAAAFYPRTVTLRLNDFKQDVYGDLVGGSWAEKQKKKSQAQGVGRYLSREYRPTFKLECEAIQKVRNTWGFDNVHIMVPFCRTPEEGDKMLKTMERFGIKRGDAGLEISVTCDIPSNVILAKEYAQLFDGFSLGTHDLAGLALGTTAQSTAHEQEHLNDPAVKQMIKELIRTAHSFNKKVSISDQHVNDAPQFTEYLVQYGIDSLSFNPDTVVPMKERIAYVEKTIGRTGRRTHKSFVSLVVMLGVLGAGLIGIGAGCSNLVSAPTPEYDPTEITPAQIREQAVAAVTKQKEEEREAMTSRLKVTSFAAFELEYPSSWTVEPWVDGITLSAGETGEYVSVYRQLVSHPVADTEKKKIIVDGAKATSYIAEDGAAKHEPVTVIEIPYEEIVIEINASTSRLEDILQSFVFLEGVETQQNPLVNHWDIREGRLCGKMLTYARASKAGGSCQTFVDPCEVPEGWHVCDGEDV